MMKVSHMEGRVRFIIMLDGISAALRYHGGQNGRGVYWTLLIGRNNITYM